MAFICVIWEPYTLDQIVGFLQKPPDLEAHVTIVQFGDKKYGLLLIFISSVCTVGLSYIT